jgi:hypothetical protein
VHIRSGRSMMPIDAFWRTSLSRTIIHTRSLRAGETT